MRDKLGRFVKGYHSFPETEFKKGNVPYLKLHPEMAKSNSGCFKKGHIPWIKGKRGVSPSEEHRKKISLAHKGKKLSEEHRRKILSRRTIPSSYEKRIINLIDKYNLPFKYVGNGSFFVGRMNPDFIHIEGYKIVIEVYGKYFKKDDYEKTRSKRMAEHNYKVIFISEKELFSKNWENDCLERLTP